MRKIHIAFSVNNNYVNHLITTIYSLLKNNASEPLFIHVLSSDISKESKQAIDSLKELNKNLAISYYSIDVASFKDFAITMNYISVETYYRLMLADLMDASIEKLLYLDADIIVHGSIASLYDETLEEEYAAGVPDVYLNQDEAYKEKIGITGSTYVNAGVLLLNLKKIREDKLTEKLIANAKVKTHLYQDQDAINVTFAHHVQELPRQFNYMVKDHQYDTLPDDEMTILHYSGSQKPWNRDRLFDAFGMLYEQYRLESTQFVNARNRNVKFGLLKYSTDNVGDSVQGIAARKFLPQIDYYFERDNMDATKTLPGETVKVIINGWWGDGPENWPPLDQNLSVLPISMYVEDRIQKEFEKPRSKQFLKAYGPVGARSKGTDTFLKSIGVESYFSGCLTLTINKDKNVPKQDFVLAIDVPDSVYETMRQQTDRPIIRIGVLRDVTQDVDEQYDVAEYYLYLYQSAHAVVTTRLHAMLPSLALETPVLFINDILDDDDVRFSGLSVLAHNLRSNDYVAHPEKFDINHPPKNKKDYLKIRASLEKKASGFTGFMSEKSYLTKPISENLKNPAFIQALVGGASKVGDLIEQNDKLKVSLSHKENHVRELAQKYEELEKKYNEVVGSRAWKMTKPIRSLRHPHEQSNG